MIEIITENRVYCRYCGSKLKRGRECVYCPDIRCQWHLGVPEQDTKITRRISDQFDMTHQPPGNG